MQYRADIDGLRAVAILPVVFFHAGYLLFGGGYVGVDIFFVISGFLITHIIAGEVREQRFSIVKFYERRIRRIFPALTVVLVFTWMAAWVVLLPERFKEFSQGLLAASLFVSNVQFWREADYFDVTAETKPLLQTWSLSVEEQFYLFFPLLLLLLRNRSRTFLIRALVAGAVASFGLGLFLMKADPPGAYFLAPGRAWQLLLGALLALGAIPKPRSQAVCEAIGAAGLALIGWSVFSYTSLTPFPGWAAVPPCLGAAMIILAGEGRETWTGKLLSLSPATFVGKISYSLYLWHWPLLVIAKHAKIEPLERGEVLFFLAVSLIAAVLSWRYVEQPFRDGASGIDRRQIFAMAGFVMISGVSVGGLGHLTDGWPNRFSREVQKLSEFDEADPLPLICSLEKPCFMGRAGVAPDIFLWGDSHAHAVASAVDRVADRQGRGVELYSRPGCIPVAGIALEPDAAGCGSMADDILARLLKEPKGQVVILTARWSRALEGELDPDRLALPMRLTDRFRRILDHDEQRRLLTAQIKKTITTLVDYGHTVVLVYPIPEHLLSVPRTLAKRAIRGLRPSSYFLPFEDYLERQDDMLEFFDSLPTGHSLITIRPQQALCPQGRCLAYADGSPLYKDGDHLSLAGAAKLTPLFAKALYEAN